ncbi:MAG: T9SS type A sorting domain-containing protein [Ignavibacteria bacterium]
MEVAKLLNENKSAGSYTIGFNAANLPSGTYFYRLETNSFTDTKKMILLK